jgi:predicted NBD/HSP70 family sugar kinase
VEYIGIDVHQRECRVCILDSTGEVMLARRVGTSRERFYQVTRSAGDLRRQGEG